MLFSGFENDINLWAFIWNILTLEKTLTTPFSTQGQHYEEEKRALSHEIIALNNHLIEAKVTIDKLSEDNVSIYYATVFILRLYPETN